MSSLFIVVCATSVTGGVYHFLQRMLGCTIIHCQLLAAAYSVCLGPCVMSLTAVFMLLCSSRLGTALGGGRAAAQPSGGHTAGADGEARGAGALTCLEQPHTSDLRLLQMPVGRGASSCRSVLLRCTLCNTRAAARILCTGTSTLPWLKSKQYHRIARSRRGQGAPGRSAPRRAGRSAVAV